MIEFRNNKDGQLQFRQPVYYPGADGNIHIAHENGFQIQWADWQDVPLPPTKEGDSE